MEAIKQILQDDSGRMSSMRLICVVCLAMAIIRCFMGCSVAELSLWIGAACGGKVIQKPFEKGSINENMQNPVL